MKGYLDSILDYYDSLSFDQLDAATVHQVCRSFLDYFGCAIYTAKNACCAPLVELILSMGAAGEQTVFGSERKSCFASAACANACRVSNIEMDDGSGINAAVHPGLYVWTAAAAAYEKQPCDAETLVKAVVFGYDLCMRLGMLAAKNVSSFDLHGPGLSGGFGAAAAAGTILGLNREQMANAVGITGALLPICPFVSFIRGTDNKDLYGGWGVYLALMAVEAAKRGLTGPKDIMDGVKSLKAFYSDGRGTDTALGEMYYINVIGFKEYPACLAVHPSMTAIERLREKNHFSASDVACVNARVHKGAYVLSSGVRLPLTPTSARLYLPYCIAVELVEGRLRPEYFNEDRLKHAAYGDLAERVRIEEEPAYAPERGGMPSCRMTIELKDGRVLSEEVKGVRWCVSGASNEGLKKKFRMLTEGILDEKEQERIIGEVMDGGRIDLVNCTRLLGELGR